MTFLCWLSVDAATWSLVQAVPSTDQTRSPDSAIFDVSCVQAVDNVPLLAAMALAIYGHGVQCGRLFWVLPLLGTFTVLNYTYSGFVCSARTAVEARERSALCEPPKPTPPVGITTVLLTVTVSR